MKYLIYFEPPPKISGPIEKYREVNSSFFVSKGNLHGTLMAARFLPEKEKEIIGALESIIFTPFDISVGTTTLFDKREGRKSLVVQIEPSVALHSLHLQIIEKSREYMSRKDMPLLEEWGEFSSDLKRRAVYERYGSPFFAEFYSPHISLGEVVPSFPILEMNPPFLPESDRVTSFYLARKEKEWKVIHEYQANHLA
ncbi:MAG: 2'-5' RNA ligase family protein [Nanoarchaeota archaeon]|nr:2'-5' RNA ligase family protein [Nanoarchaeota archaeon]